MIWNVKQQEPPFPILPFLWLGFKPSIRMGGFRVVSYCFTSFMIYYFLFQRRILQLAPIHAIYGTRSMTNHGMTTRKATLWSSSGFHQRVGWHPVFVQLQDGSMFCGVYTPSSWFRPLIASDNLWHVCLRNYVHDNVKGPHDFGFYTHDGYHLIWMWVKMEDLGDHRC